MKKNKGFSLLELLVVISIIGILISLGVASFSTAQKKSRDARRKGDIKIMQDGFEQYYTVNNGSYAEGTSCSAVVSNMGLESSNIFPAGAPLDPKGGTTYVYTCQSNISSYCVCAALETGIGNATVNDCSNLGSTTTGDFYCLTNLQ